MPRRQKRIPRESIFAPLRKLPRLGTAPSITQEFFGEGVVIPFDLMPPLALPDDHPVAEVSGFRQNDSMGLDVRRAKNEITVSIDDYEVGTLYWISTGRVDRGDFPLDLIFADVSEFHVLRCVEQGV